MNKNLALMSLVISAALSGCGSSGSDNPETTNAAAVGAPANAQPVATPQTPQVAANIINNRTVPPDPGTAANSTVAGVDTDGNGIRDEIDRYNAQTYGTNDLHYKAAQMVAKTNQKVLATDPADTNASKAAVFANADAGVCLADMMGNDDATAGRIIDDVILRVYNTKERQQRGKEVRNTVGQFTRSVKGVVCE